eukprot:4152107-Alexandrium_andersonii.AAC.1
MRLPKHARSCMLQLFGSLIPVQAIAYAGRPYIGRCSITASGKKPLHIRPNHWLISRRGRAPIMEAVAAPS